jgi:beta-galactosidase
MRKIALALAAALAFTGVAAQNNPSAPDATPDTGTMQASGSQHSEPLPWHLDPTVVAIGRELPRGEVVSHDSKADAVRQTFGASRYLQPLEKWARTETTDAVAFSTRFTVPFEWLDRRQFLHVGRASGSFTVAINDSIVAYSQTGSTPSEFDITRTSKEGVNSLTITIFKDPIARQVENSRKAAEPRIEGEVYILSQPRVRVRDVSIDTRMEGSSGLLELGVILKSHQLNAHNFTVYWELLNQPGEIVAEGKRDTRLDMRREDTVHFFANIPRVVPWSHEQPQLYTLFIKTQNEGRFREYLAFKVGFRSLDLDDEGALRLNGVPLDLVMREFSPGGPAAAADSTSATVSTMDVRAEVLKLRAEGVNALMLRGAPPRREFFALCDSLGVYVACMADIDTHMAGESRRVGGNPSNDPAWNTAYLDRTATMYHTSKNHPSVAMFSLAERSANGLNLYDSYVSLKQLERHRPVLYTDGGGEWNSDLLAGGASDDVSGDVSGDLPGGASGIDDGARNSQPAAIDLSKNSRPARADRAKNSPLYSPDWLALDVVELPEVPEGTTVEARFRVTNSRRITPLTGEVVYRIVAGRRKVVAGGTKALEVLPDASTEFAVPVIGVKPGRKYHVKIEIAIPSTDGNYLPASDPNLKVYRRLDLPLHPEARVTILGGEFER